MLFHPQEETPARPGENNQVPEQCIHTQDCGYDVCLDTNCKNYKPSNQDLELRSEVEVPKPGMLALKQSEGKVDLSLLPPMPLIEIAKVYMFGMVKYDRWDWARGTSFCKIFAASLRHGWKWFWGETYDPESGLHHLAHAAWGFITLVQFSFGKHYQQFDDRPRIAIDLSDPNIAEIMSYRIPSETLETWTETQRANAKKLGLV